VKKGIAYGGPTDLPTDDAAAREREGREADDAKYRELRLREEREKREMAEKLKAVLESIEPHDRREAMPMRQISITVTEEQHQTLTARAREARVTLRKLIAVALKPLWEK